jgi:hypothetical protein
MNPRRILTLALSGVALALTIASSHDVRAATGSASYQLQARVVGAGGTPMQGAGGWSLDGTIAQADAVVQQGAAQWRLDGGFWSMTSAAATPSDRIFANGFEHPPIASAGAEERH